MRNSDRWITPGVIVTLLLGLIACVLATIAAVTWLTAQGRDPEPMLKLVGLCVTAASGLAGFLLQMFNRVTQTKTERNVGQLAAEVTELRGAHQESLSHMASALYDVADALPKPVVPRHSAGDTGYITTAAPGPRGG